jgi:predicted amidophosphoribosyltransferase
MTTRTHPRIVCSFCEKPIRLSDVPLCKVCREAVTMDDDDANREMGLPEVEDWGTK